MFKYLFNGLIGLGILFVALCVGGLAVKVTGWRGAGVIFLGLTMGGDLILRGFINLRRRRRDREPLWFLVPSIGGHYSLIPTWVWGALVILLGIGMFINDLQTARENRANLQAYEQRLQEKARKEAEKPLEPPPKKTGFDLDLRRDGKTFWVVMTSHHPGTVTDVKLTVQYLIGNVRYEVLRLTVASWAPEEQRASDKWQQANPNLDSVEVFGDGKDPLWQRVEIKMRWLPNTGHGP